MVFKIVHETIQRADLNHIVEQIKSRLASWKSRLLNKLGGVANAILSTVPYYGVQIVWYPQYVCDYIDNSNKRFM